MCTAVALNICRRKKPVLPLFPGHVPVFAGQKNPNEIPKSKRHLIYV